MGKYYPFSVRYYCFHPWDFIGQTFRNIRWAYQRITRGFSDADCWNLDSYLLEIIPEMVDNLRKNTHGFPVSDRFFTFEDWDKFLLEEIIIPLRNAREDQSIQNNEYDYVYDEFPSRIENHQLIDDMPEELRKNWVKREKEIYEWREDQRIKGFSALIDKDVFHSLWD